MYVGRKEIWGNVQENINSDSLFLVGCMMSIHFVLFFIISSVRIEKKDLNL